MSFLKQGVSLALVGAGLALSPLTVADASAPPDHSRLTSAKPGQLSHASGKTVEQLGNGGHQLPRALQAAKQAGGRQAFLLVLDGRSTSAAYQAVRKNLSLIHI